MFCDKLMIQVTKTLTILCLMMFHSTKMKNDWLFGKKRKKLSFLVLSLEVGITKKTHTGS